MRECPRCKTINEPSAETCDCGYQLCLAPAMQPAAMLRPIFKSSGLQTAGIVVCALTALAWVFYLTLMPRNFIWEFIFYPMIGIGIIAAGIGLVMIFAGRA